MKTPHFRATFSVLHLSSTHLGPRWETRIPGILLPNLSGKLFLLVYSDFRHFLICFTYSLTLLSPLFPGVPEPYVVIYVVKNASRPIFGECSPMPDGKRFAFQIICIVTLRRELCKRLGVFTYNTSRSNSALAIKLVLLGLISRIAGSLMLNAWYSFAQASM